MIISTLLTEPLLHIGLYIFPVEIFNSIHLKSNPLISGSSLNVVVYRQFQKFPLQNAAAPKHVWQNITRAQEIIHFISYISLFYFRQWSSIYIKFPSMLLFCEFVSKAWTYDVPARIDTLYVYKMCVLYTRCSVDISDARQMMLIL